MKWVVLFIACTLSVLYAEIPFVDFYGAVEETATDTSSTISSMSVQCGNLVDEENGGIDENRISCGMDQIIVKKTPKLDSATVVAYSDTLLNAKSELKDLCKEFARDTSTPVTFYDKYRKSVENRLCDKKAPRRDQLLAIAEMLNGPSGCKITNWGQKETVEFRKVGAGSWLSVEDGFANTMIRQIDSVGVGLDGSALWQVTIDRKMKSDDSFFKSKRIVFTMRNNHRFIGGCDYINFGSPIW